MSRLTWVGRALLVATVFAALVTPASAKTVFGAGGFLWTDQNQKHPRTASRVLVVPEALSDVEHCFFYLNDRSGLAGNEGRVTVTTTFTLPDGTIKTRELSGRVKDFVVEECGPAPNLPPGTLVESEFEFNGFKDFPGERCGRECIIYRSRVSGDPVE